MLCGTKNAIMCKHRVTILATGASAEIKPSICMRSNSGPLNKVSVWYNLNYFNTKLLHFFNTLTHCVGKMYWCYFTILISAFLLGVFHLDSRTKREVTLRHESLSSDVDEQHPFFGFLGCDVMHFCTCLDLSTFKMTFVSPSSVILRLYIPVGVSKSQVSVSNQSHTTPFVISLSTATCFGPNCEPSSDLL